MARDRGHPTRVPLELAQRRAAEAQAAARSVLANRVRRDTAWLRQGIQGRQTRNKTQVDDATTRV